MALPSRKSSGRGGRQRRVRTPGRQPLTFPDFRHAGRGWSSEPGAWLNCQANIFVESGRAGLQSRRHSREGLRGSGPPRNLASGPTGCSNRGPTDGGAEAPPVRGPLEVALIKPVRHQQEIASPRALAAQDQVQGSARTADEKSGRGPPLRLGCTPLEKGE